MRIAPLLLLLASLLAGAALAQGPYQLYLDPKVEKGELTLTPILQGPPQAEVRYEMVSTKVAGAGRSSTSQTSTVVLNSSGAASLATLRLGLARGDRYVITVTVFDGAMPVAEGTVRYP